MNVEALIMSILTSGVIAAGVTGWWNHKTQIQAVKNQVFIKSVLIKLMNLGFLSSGYAFGVNQKSIHCPGSISKPPISSSITLFTFSVSGSGI